MGPSAEDLRTVNRGGPPAGSIANGGNGTVQAETMNAITRPQGQLDQVFEILSHPYRRRILTMIDEHNPRDGDEFSMAELADPDSDLSVFTRELYHSHLPKLADAGYIEWDRETDVIRRGPRFNEIAPLVSLMQKHADELPADWP